MNNNHFNEWLKTTTEQTEELIYYLVKERTTELLYKIIEGSRKEKELEEKNELYVPELFFSNGTYVGQNPLMWAMCKDIKKVTK